MTTFPLPGSERTVLAGARCVGNADPAEQLEVIVMLRRQASDELRDMVGKLVAGDCPAQHLTRAQFAEKFGAAAQDIAKLHDFARQHGLNVVREDAASNTVVLSGAVERFNAAFNVALQRYESPLGNYRGRTGPLHIPEQLRGIVTAVLGLDDRPQARPQLRFRPPFRFATQRVSAAYLPTQVAALYNFPDNLGAGQCIGIIELGGGYHASDLHAYFLKLGVTPPVVTPVPVGQGGNHPSGDPNGPDSEVTLDIEIAGAIASAARIAVYFSVNSDIGFINAINSAVHDTLNQPSVISISWGSPESSWTQQSMQAFNAVLQAAASMGVTVCVAAGDSGSSDGVGDGGSHIDFPASSPYALACGGTTLEASGNTVESEVVWNDGSQGGAGGGGVSAVFALPAWQQGLTVTDKIGGAAQLVRRGVPDVAGNADPMTGYTVLVNGVEAVVGGTSAVAPLWAALVARINASKGSAAGYLNARLYRQQAAFNDITKGNNGSFSAAPGWDACTGLGSPNGQKIADAL